MVFDSKNIVGNSVEIISQELNKELQKVGIANIPLDILYSMALDLSKRSKLRIMVLGPGETQETLYNKRCEIRDELNRLGHQAEFPEETWSEIKLKISEINLAVAEYIQAKEYDFIVCLMASPGSIGEVHELAGNKQIASKMLICVDEINREGYSSQGILRIFEGFHGKIDWFKNPNDIDNCCLATRAIEHLQKVAESKQFELSKEVRSL